MQVNGSPLLWFTLLAFAANVAAAVLYRRMRKGRFVVLDRTSTGASFRTDLAVFHVDAAHGTVALTAPEGLRTAPLETVRAVRIRASEQRAWLEELMRGFDLTDFARRYRDTMQWTTISLRFDDGSEWPVFVAGEYQPREFLKGGYLKRQQQWLLHMGWITHVPTRVREVADEIAALLERGGAQVSIESLGVAVSVTVTGNEAA